MVTLGGSICGAYLDKEQASARRGRRGYVTRCSQTMRPRFGFGIGEPQRGLSDNRQSAARGVSV